MENKKEEHRPCVDPGQPDPLLMFTENRGGMPVIAFVMILAAVVLMFLMISLCYSIDSLESEE